MAKIYGGVEVGLTRVELRQALRSWMDRKTLISSYRITDISLHPNAEVVVRFTVEPPLEKPDQEKLAQPEVLEQTS